MKNYFKILILASCLVSFGAVAQSSGKSQKAQRGYRLPAYGMAGCGLGTLVFPNRPDSGTQLGTAAVNNVGYFLGLASNLINYPLVILLPGVVTFGPSSDYQSSSITTGTSNCGNSPSSEEALRMERETYVAVNLNDLSKEASQGSGERLQSLAEILGCGDDRNFVKFAQVAQNSHAEIFSDSEPSNVTQRILSVAQADSELNTCLRAK